MESEGTYRWTLSPPPVTESEIFSVVDLELFGVTWSATSGRSVSEGAMRWRGGRERTVVEILAAGVRTRHVGGGVRVVVLLVGVSECC